MCLPAPHQKTIAATDLASLGSFALSSPAEQRDPTRENWCNQLTTSAHTAAKGLARKQHSGECKPLHLL